MTESIEMIKAIANDSKVRIDRIVANYEQLEKENAEAKEHIKKLIEAIHIWDCKNLEEVETEAEQFLKDSEVEKC